MKKSIYNMHNEYICHSYLLVVAKQYCVMLLLIVGADRGGLEPGRSHGNHGNGGVSVGTMGHPKH